MRPVCHPYGHVFDIFISAKSNDITNMFCKFHSYTENCINLHIRYYNVL